jgi:adenine/guanine phosphoribosyltransferase-like PRPP-binding protein
VSRLGYSAYYLRPVFDPARFTELVAKIVVRVRQLKTELRFDAIAFRGNSGAAFAYPVSAATGIPLLCVRKGESTHSSAAVEGPVADNGVSAEIDTYLILDDQVSSGETMRAIIDAIRQTHWQGGPPPTPVGVLLWDQEDRTDFETGNGDECLPVFHP